MSKYLKWYVTYLDNTPTEDLAKNELESAHRKIKQLTESLAKANEDYKALFSAFQNCHDELVDANERLKELEKELKESEDALDAEEQQLSSYENALEEVQAVFVDNDACPLFEPFNPKNLSAWLNKFAIEKKIEALRKFEPISNSVANHWCDKEQKGYLWLHAEILAEIEKLEQLLKE